MNKLTKIALALATVAALSSTANAATTPDASASVVVSDALAITEANAIDFGSVSAPTAGQPDLVVEMDTAGTRTMTNTPGTTDGFLVGGNGTAGQYSLAGSNGRDIIFSVSNVTAAASGVNLSKFEGTYAANLIDFTANTGTTQTLDTTEKLALAATLTVPAGTTPGKHTVEFDVNVDYQ